MSETAGLTVLIKGGGEVASGVAHRLHRSRLRVCLTEVAAPRAVSRGVTFSEAVFDGVKEVMGVRAELVLPTAAEISRVWRQGDIPIVVDPEATVRAVLRPAVLVDAIMAKRNTGTRLTDARLVIGLGPGFTAGRDVHVVVETNHGPNLGRVIREGEAEENTGEPVAIGGLTRARVIWAPRAGTFTSAKGIGDTVAAGEVVAEIDGQPLFAPMAGMLRGLIRSGVKVARGSKLLEVDPVNDPLISRIIVDKIRAIGEGVLTAITQRFDLAPAVGAK